MAIAISTIYSALQVTSATPATATQTMIVNTLVVVAVNVTGGFTCNSFSDFNGTVYSAPVQMGPSAGGLNIWVGYGLCTSGGSTTIKGNLSGSTSTAIVACTFTGFAGGIFFDNSIFGTGLAGVFSSGSFTTRNASEVLIGVAEIGVGSNITWTQDPAYTSFAGFNNGGGAAGKTICMGYKILAGTGSFSYAPTSTGSASTIAGFIGVSDSAIASGTGILSPRIWVMG